MICVLVIDRLPSCLLMLLLLPSLLSSVLTEPIVTLPELFTKLPISLSSRSLLMLLSLLLRNVIPRVFTRRPRLVRSRNSLVSLHLMKLPKTPKFTSRPTRALSSKVFNKSWTTSSRTTSSLSNKSPRRTKRIEL